MFARTSAMPLMPDPPIPTKWSRRALRNKGPSPPGPRAPEKEVGHVGDPGGGIEPGETFRFHGHAAPSLGIRGERDHQIHDPLARQVSVPHHESGPPLLPP